jgi:hypothetical protein
VEGLGAAADASELFADAESVFGGSFFAPPELAVVVMPAGFFCAS